MHTHNPNQNLKSPKIMTKTLEAKLVRLIAEFPQLDDVIGRLLRGQHLTREERQELREIVAHDTKDTAPEGWAVNLLELASALGVHRNTVSRHVKDCTHPKRRDGVGWNVSECRRWYELNGTLKPGCERREVGLTQDEKDVLKK
jgi:predicted DNA-binding transcriptional regulator AlpA